MKLTREDIRINLQGKNKEVLTSIYNLLVSLKQPMYSSLERNLIDLRDWEYYEFYEGKWCLSNDDSKKEVTIEQLKEILQPMESKEKQLIEEAKRRGFLTEGNEFYSCFSDKNKLRIIKPYNSKLEINLYLDSGGCLRYYDGLDNKYDGSLCSNPAIYKDGVWAEILQPMEMVDLMGYSVLVDNDEQAKKLQEIAFEQGFKWRGGAEEIEHLGAESFQFGHKGEKVITYNYYGGNHYQDEYITKKAHFNDLFKEETLQEKEQRLLKELEEVRKEIEENNIKVGDWVVVNKTDTIFKVKENDFKYIDYRHKKITNTELIKLLEQEIK